MLPCLWLRSHILWAPLMLRKTHNSFMQHPGECTPPPHPTPPTTTAQVPKPKRKQTPISNLSAGTQRMPGPPSPPPTPHPTSTSSSHLSVLPPFSSACLLRAPQPNHRRPLHSYDLSPGMPPKPNRSDLQQGGPPGRQERDRGCVSRGYKAGDGEGGGKDKPHL